MTAAPDNLPDDIAALRAALAAEQLARREAEARASGAEAMVAHLKLLIARLKRDKYGASSERGRKLIDQLELELGELVTAASEDAAKAEKAAGKNARSERPGMPPRGQPVRAPLPAHLPRERVVLPAPTACPCCGGRLSKLGEDITETLETEPIKWKVIQTVRERFSCRACETITQPPAPFHPIARGRAGPNLLAMILEAKFGQHLPLNRQSETFALQGIELSVSTIADWVGASTANLAPLNALIDAHVLAAERLHGDDTTVPVLTKGKTITGRVWTYVRDDRPFGGRAPPAAMFRYSRDRTAEHPNRHLAGYAGILQADAYAGYNALYEADRKPGSITEAACWAHGRRKLFELAELSYAPLAIEAVRRIDAIFDAERAINGLPAAERLAVRQQHIAPLVTELEAWMRENRGKLSRHNPVAKAMDYMLTRWETFTRFLSDGRICLTNNAAERALRGIALGRKSWLFAGSDRGGDRAAAMYSLSQAERRRSARLAGRRPRPHRRPPRLPLGRAAAVELGPGKGEKGGGMTSNSIARLKITLDEVEPAVLRRVEVPLTIRLDRLHLVLQAAMGWTNSHLYEIRARDVGWGLPDPDWGEGPLDARKTRLLDVLEDTGAKTLKSLYDFGDGWEHTLKVERLTDSMPGLIYPFLINATGRCPPEDVGGPWGHAEFLEAIADPKHENHTEMVQWAGAPFDPNTIDFDEHAKAVEALAKAWSRKPATKRKPAT